MKRLARVEKAHIFARSGILRHDLNNGSKAKKINGTADLNKSLWHAPRTTYIGCAKALIRVQSLPALSGPFLYPFSRDVS